MKPIWHEEAVMEHNASSVYYEKKSAGLGERFIGEVESTIARILYTPESWRIFQHGCRKMNLRLFPYSVIYTMRSERVYIVALMHQSRRPGYWARRSK